MLKYPLGFKHIHKVQTFPKLEKPKVKIYKLEKHVKNMGAQHTLRLICESQFNFKKRIPVIIFKAVNILLLPEMFKVKMTKCVNVTSLRDRWLLLYLTTNVYLRFSF